jgi:DNA mismatch repair protein MutS2
MAWDAALEALEFPAVLARVAGLAVGPLGAARIMVRRPLEDVVLIREVLGQVDELARLERAGRGVMAEAVPSLSAPLARLRIGGSVLDGQELLAVRRTLTAGRLVAAELARVEPDAPRAAALAAPAPDKQLEKRLHAALDDEGGVRDGASPALAAARSDIHIARERLLQRLEAILRRVGGDGGVTLREGRYVIPVARDRRDRPDGIVHGESASGATLYLEPAAAIPLGNALREAEARAQREELKVLRDLTDLLRPHAAPILALHEMCVAVDDLAARARYAVQVDGHLPSVAPAPAPLAVVNGRHPLLLDPATATGAGPRPPLESSSRATASPAVVPFDLVLDGHERTVLLSGPNTGGKSVLLKAVGLQLALAQSGIIPPVGPGSSLPVVRRIYADIGDRQSIAASLSTFSAHLTLLRRVLDDADDASLVLLDEIGSGTDPAEGAALAAASLLALTRRGTLTLATTHLGALKRLATTSPGVVNASLQFDAATLQPTYRLQKGVPGRSYGLAIARRLGLRADVLAEADGHVPEAERSLDALLAAVEQRQREQDLKASELAGRQADVEMRSENLAAQAALQQQREATLRQQEKQAERAAREQARQFLLGARAEVDQAIARAGQAGEDAAREARRLVEQAIQAEAEALGRLDGAATRPEGDTAAAFNAGDPVRLQAGTTGEVLETRGDGKVVVRVGSLKLVAEAASLSALPRRDGPPNRRATVAASHGDATAEYELDLRGLTGDEAEQAVIAAIDRAVLAEQPYLRVIHGKGTGVVRERVQRVADADRRVASHAFAPANQGGTGVTIVELGR